MKRDPLDPFTISKHVWAYRDGTGLDVYYEVRKGEQYVRTENVRLPVRKLVEALRLLGYTVRPPSKP